MILWRIAADTRQYRADDLSGGGAAKRPGRWNDTSEAVIYAAPTIAIAVLETAAHVDDSGVAFKPIPGGVEHSRRRLGFAERTRCCDPSCDMVRNPRRQGER